MRQISLLKQDVMEQQQLLKLVIHHMPHLFLPHGIVLSNKLSNTHSIVMPRPPGNNLKVDKTFFCHNFLTTGWVF